MNQKHKFKSAGIGLVICSLCGRRASDDVHDMAEHQAIGPSFTSKRGACVSTIIQSMLLMMMDGVDKFQKKVLGFPAPTEPQLLSESRHAFRTDFIKEELSEYALAYREGRLDDAVDAWVDLIYVALGALLEMGIEPMAAFDPVQSANMAKVRGMTKRGDTYDAQKPEGWTPPDHAAVIAELVLRSQVPPAFLEATKIMLERAAAYNSESTKREEHFPLGDVSFFQMMWVKMARMKADVTSGRSPNRDHLIDIMNYANFWINHLDGRPL